MSDRKEPTSISCTASLPMLWKEYFRDPSQWWDNRSRKVHPGYPDFKHKGTKQCLWIDNPCTPSWVTAELSRRSMETPLPARPVICDDCTAFVVSLRACAKSKDLRKGSLIHEEILRKGLVDQCSDALITMYAKCGALVKAQELLDIHSSRNAYTWTAMITAYAQHKQARDALRCFEHMQLAGLSPDAVTFACVLNACSSVQDIDKGRKIHAEIIRQGLIGDDVVLGNALLDMYAKCGALSTAQYLLQWLPSRDVVSWNALISGYTLLGQGEQALRCFEQMQIEGFSPTSVTFTCILEACGSIGALEKGEEVFYEIAKQELFENNIVLGTATVDMFAKCGALSKAQQVFQNLPSRDVVSWNALIAGYAAQGQGNQALECFAKMQQEGISANEVTYSCILDACGSLGALDKGTEVHHEITRQNLLQTNIVLSTAVVDMYVKCGAFQSAEQVVEELPLQAVAPWNSLITGYARQGQSDQALKCFKLMIHRGINPDAVTFTGVLNACSHLGLTDEGLMHFMSMKKIYNVKPDIGHYTCMIDLFGRSGQLDKAMEVIKEMPPGEDLAVWSALLGACQKWGDVNVGKRAFEHSVELSQNDAAAYALMANIYATASLYNDAEKVEV
ncbi:hypothetical protein KP509_09G010600 [Ceratopteris richardii]|nr:hypothetical protein KP509_09G010600 [Ceratopteris richardii]